MSIADLIPDEMVSAIASHAFRVNWGREINSSLEKGDRT
jgi:hypothetical protein